MSEQSFAGHRHARPGEGALERIASGLHGAMEHALHAEAIGARSGLLQRLDPRVKLVGLLALIVACTSAHRLAVVYALLLLAVALALASRIALRHTLVRLWVSVLLFTGVLALPAIFLVPGRTAWTVPALGWAVSYPGLQSAAFLVGRALACASLALLLILTTPWPHVLKALQTLRVPSVFIVILGMTYRYIFLLLQVALDLQEARRSRTAAPLRRQGSRRVIVINMGILLGKTMQLAQDVHLAMIARGYQGAHRTLHDFHMAGRDWAALAAFGGVAGLAFWLGR